MKYLNLFKLEYTWYEGEFESTILATTKDKKDIEKDLKEAVKKVKIKDGKHSVDCLPSQYEGIIMFLIKKGYTICYFIKDPIYEVSDDVYPTKSKKLIRRYMIENREKKTVRRKL